MSRGSEASRGSERPPYPHFGTFVEIRHDAVAVIDRLGIVRYMSPAGRDLLGRRPEDVIGTPVSERIHPEDLPRIREILATHDPEALGQPIAYRMRHKNRRWHWLEAMVPPMSTYVPDHLTVFIRDITKQKQLEDRDRLTETIASCGTWRFDIDDPHPQLSPGLIRLLGFDPAEADGKPKFWPINRLAQGDFRRVMKTLRHVLREPQVFSFDCRVRGEDGDIKVLRTGGHVETDADGRGVAILGVSRDITTMDHARKRLRQSEQKYRLLTERVSDIICQVGPDGTLEFVSPSIERITGRRPEDLVGTTCSMLFLEDEREKVERFLARVRQGGDAGLCTVRMRNGGPHPAWLELSARLLDDQEPESSVVCAARDVTERRQFIAELQAARLQAEEASVSKSRFLANVSHDLRTPLNAILGFAELIREQIFGEIGDSRYVEYAALIHESGTMLRTFLTDLLDLSRIEAGRYELHPRLLELDEIIPSCLHQIAPLATRKRLRVSDRISGDGLKLHADGRALTQILVNLLSNAAKYTPEGGAITLSTHRTDGMLALRVSDTGIGIDPVDLPRITEPFEQTGEGGDGVRQGAGLGLAIVKSLVDLQGGRLTIESAPGEGTAVTVTLPAGPSREAG